MRQAKRDTSWKEIETEGKWQKNNMKLTEFTTKKRNDHEKGKTRRYTKGKKEEKETKKKTQQKEIKEMNKNDEKEEDTWSKTKEQRRKKQEGRTKKGSHKKK